MAVAEVEGHYWCDSGTPDRSHFQNALICDILLQGVKSCA